MPNNQISFSGKIHQILHSEIGNQLLIHISEKEQLDSIHLVDIDSKETLMTWNANKDTPNLSIRSFDSERIVAISFSQIQNPDLVDVLVYDWKEDEPIYVFPNTKLIASNANMLEIKHPMIENKTRKIDLSSGNEVSQNVNIESNEMENVHFPKTYDSSSAYFIWFEKILNQEGKSPKIQCEHMEYHKTHLISYYEQLNKSLTNYLSIIDKNGKFQESFTLASDLKGIGNDTFFVIENKTIFVTNHNTLNVYHL
ncbi:MAG: hypothetical protein JXR07_14570 [Reichenbachiella sp.]